MIFALEVSEALAHVPMADYTSWATTRNQVYKSPAPQSIQQDTGISIRSGGGRYSAGPMCDALHQQPHYQSV